MTNLKPFLKWAGGKTQLIPQLEEHLPDMSKIDTFIEPFLGGGAFLLHLTQKYSFKKIVLNDYNPDLVNVYLTIQKEPAKLIKLLQNMQDEYWFLDSLKQEKYYYEVREKFNLIKHYTTPAILKPNVELAVYFIFLNKTCFNGLYRVNKDGAFNVPFGKHKKPVLFEEENIKGISSLLKKATILCGSYEEVSKEIEGETFIYLDPPYRPVAPSDRGNIYIVSGFNDEAQTKLGEWFTSMASESKVKLMLSNSDPTMLDKDDDFFNKLYKEFSINIVTARRSINRQGNGRGNVRELLVTSYQD